MFILGILAIIIPCIMSFIPTGQVLAISIIGILISYGVACGLRTDILRLDFNSSEKNYLICVRPNYSIYNIMVIFSIITIPQIIVNYLLFLFLGPVYAFMIVFGMLCLGGIISYFNSKNIVSDWNSFNYEEFKAGKDASVAHIKTESYINIFIPSVSIPYLIVTKVLSLVGVMNRNSQTIKNAKG